MRLLILGAGGIGGYFGGRLADAGVDVAFLVRKPRAERLARGGLVITSPYGDLTIRPKTITEAAGRFDAVLVSCKAYDLDSAVDAIAPAVGDGTLVVPLLNGLKHYAVLDERFGAEKVAGGLAHIGVTMTPDGVIRHLNTLQRFTLGPRSAGQQAACETLHAELARGGFAPVLSEDVDRSMWEKYVLLAAFAGLTCLMRAPVGAIMRAEDGKTIAEGFIAECAAVAKASGHAMPDKVIEETRALMETPGSKGTASMLRDLEGGGKTEHDQILGDMLRRARGFGIAAPMLTVAYAHMQAYEARRTEG